MRYVFSGATGLPTVVQLDIVRCVSDNCVQPYSFKLANLTPLPHSATLQITNVTLIHLFLAQGTSGCRFPGLSVGPGLRDILIL